MKPFLCAVLAMLLLCGCAANTPEPTEATHLSAAAPTEPAGSYESGSLLELASGGAVRVYPQNLGHIWKIKAVGDDLLVFSDRDTTTITRLTGENLFRVAETQLDCCLSPQSPSLYISEERIAYYDDNTRELVFLNQDLREIQRMALPEDLVGEPVLTPDRMQVYYCTDAGVRCLEIESGISRLVKEMTFARQSMVAVHMGGTVLQVQTLDGRGNLEKLFLDARSGALIGALPEDMELHTGTAFFYATDPEGMVNQMIFGTGEEVWQLQPENYRDSGVFLPEVHAAAVFTAEGTLDYYDLSEGKRTGSLNLGDMQPRSLTADDAGDLYFLDADSVIYRWKPAASPTGDAQVYVDSRYTLGDPNVEGLDRCRAYAAALSQQFGLDIQLLTEAVSRIPEDYDLIPEYQVPVIWDALTQLEEILKQYPAGMFSKAVEDMENGKLTLLLVRDIRGGYALGNPDTVDGHHFWQDNHSYVVLSMGDQLEQTFYHEMFHALETRLLSQSIALYRWDELNPKGFEYDYDCQANQTRGGDEYLEDETRAFIDTHSMHFPKEDRAKVMEYACMPGNENYFISETMQKKLRTLCVGIREAYDLEDDPQPLLWEQYLESPAIK